MLTLIPKPLVKIEIMDRKDSQKVDGVQLIRTIADKDKDEEAAKKALDLFVSSFESKIKKRVEILALNYGYNENVAFEAYITITA